jgi:tyrosyl-tRNA synthetase
MAAHAADPGKRLAQHLLASEVLELVHGRETAEITRSQHQAMRNPSLASRGQSKGERTFLPRSLVAGAPFARIMWHAGITATKSEAARLVKSGGVYVASASASAPGGSAAGQESELKFAQVKDQKPEDVESFSKDGLIVLRTGKWKVRVVEVVDDEVFESEGHEAPGWAEWKKSREA